MEERYYGSKLPSGQKQANSVFFQKQRRIRDCWSQNRQVLDTCRKESDSRKRNLRKVNINELTRFSANAQLAAIHAFSSQCFTGDEKGNLLEWAGKSVAKVKKLSDHPLTVLLFKKNILYSGSQDGNIRLLNPDLDIIRCIRVCELTCFTPGIKALDIDERTDNLLIGTKGCEIILLNLRKDGDKGRFLARGHYDGELWGLTVCPKNPFLFASGGDDHVLRIYNAKTNRMVKHLTLEHDFRAVDWSSNGKFITIGSVFGKIFNISLPNLNVESTYQSIFKKKEEWIQELKISPECKFVAFGAHGSSFKVEILKVEENGLQLQPHAVINCRVTSAITHLDWSSCGNFLVVNSLAFELKFISVHEKKVVQASSMSSTDWYTWTCIFGFNVVGIWDKDASGYSVNYSCVSKSKKVLATGDDFSLVKLFRAPCTVNRAKFKAFKGHSSHVPKVRFSKDDRFLFSVGGNDKSVFVWETDFADENDEDHVEIFEENNEEIANAESFDKGDEVIMEVNTERTKEENKIEKTEQKEEKEEEYKFDEEDKNQNMGDELNPNENQEEKPEIEEKEKVEGDAGIEENKNLEKSQKKNDMENELLQEEEGKIKILTLAFVGDQKLSIEPWRGHIHEPTNAKNLPKDLKEAPNVKASPEYVFGYKSRETRNNLKYLNDTTIVYHTGGLIVVHNFEENTQTLLGKGIFIGELTSFAVHKEARLVAGSDAPKSGGKQRLVIYNYDTSNEVLRLDDINPKGLSDLAFSESGSLIACVGADEEHCLILIDIHTKQILVSEKCGKNRVLDVCFNGEKVRISLKFSKEIATVGINYFVIWTLTEDRDRLMPKDAGIKANERIGVVLCHNGKFLTGSGSGEVALWEDGSAVISKPLHKKPVDTVYFKNDKYQSLFNFSLFSAGRDCFLHVLTESLEILKTFDLNKMNLGTALNFVMAIDINESSSKLLLGFVSSEILELVSDQGEIFSAEKPEVKRLVQFHNSVSAASTLPNNATCMVFLAKQNQVFTLSEDFTAKVWDMTSNKLVKTVKLENDCKKPKNLPYSVDANPAESAVCIGFKEEFAKVKFGYNFFQVFSYPSFTLVKKIVLKEGANEVKYSPCGKFLAIASSDKLIYIVDTRNNEKLQGLQGHSGPAYKLSWSLDSAVLMSNSLSGEMLFWDASNWKQQPKGGAMFKDESWDKFSCVFGWYHKAFNDYRSLQGLWKNGFNVSDVISVSRSPNRELLISSDVIGLQLRRFPSPANTQKALSLNGHGSIVSNVCFISDNAFVTLGLLDGTLIKWKIANK